MAVFTILNEYTMNSETGEVGAETTPHLVNLDKVMDAIRVVQGELTVTEITMEDSSVIAVREDLNELIKRVPR